MPERKDYQLPSPDGFGFTRDEDLFYKVSNDRFRAMLFDDLTTIHTIQVDGNNYGSFLFVTASRPKAEGRECITFFSFGFHEYRDRWITDEWFYYRANQFPQMIEQELSKEEAEELLKAREEEIAPYIGGHQQSRRGQLFEMIADLTDDDAASVELEDLGPLFFDDLEE
jgi:hypothetical protein